jgi:hypothetical protein
MKKMNQKVAQPVPRGRLEKEKASSSTATLPMPVVTAQGGTTTHRVEICIQPMHLNEYVKHIFPLDTVH